MTQALGSGLPYKRRGGRVALVVLAAVALMHTSVLGVTSAQAAVSGTGGGVSNGATAGLDATAAAPAPFGTIDVNGDYVAAGTGMRNRGFGTINLGGIPPTATIARAYLYWTVFAPTFQAAFAKGTFRGTAITGTTIGTGGDPCWGATNGWAFRADVTALVGGNGAYKLSGFSSGRVDGADPFTAGVTSTPPILDGASLVAVFSKTVAPAYPPTRILISNGYGLTSGTVLSSTMSFGFAATNPVGAVKTTFIGADGQKNFAEPVSTFNGSSIVEADWDGTDLQSGAQYAQGNLWDTDTRKLSNLVKPGQTSATVRVTGGPDCLVWTAQVLSIGKNGALDTDGDKLLDGWEANGYDADNNGTIDVNLPALGASPLRKDLYVEMDYMGAEAACPCHLPLAADLSRIRAVYAGAPFANNPDRSVGINLHLDAGAARGAAYNLGGGNLVAHDGDLNPVLTQFNAIKTANFNPKRAKIFYYMIWAHGYDGGSSSGNAFAIPSDSLVVTLGLWGGHGSSDEKVGTFVHEFGHNLGLSHGGNEGKNNKPNYLSVMTYAFQTSGVPRTGVVPPYFGYSSADLPDLVETTLNEAVGLNSAAANTYKTKYYCPSGVLTQTPGTANGPIDWTCGGTISAPVSVDLNKDTVKNTLTGWNDWGNLVYGGGAVGPGDALGIEAPPLPAPDELTYEEDQRNRR